ncbi:putative membrane protein YfcA [Catenuloplanes nepalensis]|uniref:Membrane protein YfcA n=1 Tax=Catenuloplanes nepalensis TaxID=587533 RepID=A0ABT9N252_9ACTN|nr:hypothetical protein [Catenuloplanes nepalensis]MDP9797780.1 putative membrane protein YfcA [Catenuloplanes nepalensis]
MEKIVLAMTRSAASVVLMYLIGFLVLGDVPWHSPGVPLMVASLLLGGWVGASIGSRSARWCRPRRSASCSR